MNKDQRTQQIIALFRAGWTLRRIADRYGISHQRVQQILNANGLKGKDGGCSARKRRREEARIARREKKCMEKYGCTLEQYEQLKHHPESRRQAPLYAFFRQRNNAYKRGIEWEFSLWEWWCIWQESGKWDKRGRNLGDYCMCRVNDEGGYTHGNVYIGTVTHNLSLGRTLAHERPNDGDIYRAVNAAGGRVMVADALDVTPAYVSQVCADKTFPAVWLEDGRIEKLASLTCGAFTFEHLASFARTREVA